MPHYQSIHLSWTPGHSLDTERLERMQEEFRKPDKLPPIAWFMGGIDYYDEVETYSRRDLVSYLDDTRGGILSFGRLKVWVDWFLFLLPSLIEKDLEFSVIEYFFAIYPHEIYEEYIGYHKDIFHTLMQSIMQEKYWKDGDLIIPEWAEGLDKYEPGWYDDVGSPLYESLEFCIKYLPAPDVPEWVESITKIDGKIWKLQVKYWLTRFKKHPYNYNVPDKRIKLFFEEISQYPGYEDL